MGQPTPAAARAKARRRNREHLKRASVSDITAEQELEMRRKARKCPLCHVYMTSKPNRPNSKHLDHIIPVGIGGTHTHGNVRIICAGCNLHRPKDGSDYTGPITLWAQGEIPVKRPRKKYAVNMVTCRKGLHPWTPENIVMRADGKKRCKICARRDKSNRPSQAKRPNLICKCGTPYVAPGRTVMCPGCTDAAARKAAELHAAGGMTWREVAAAVGYGTAEGARFAAKRIGYVPRRAQGR